MISRVFILILLILIGFISATRADILYLKNGDIVEGLITKENEEGVEIDLGFGTIIFSKEEIESIYKSKDDEAVSIRQEWEKQKRLKEEGAKKDQELEEDREEKESEPKRDRFYKRIEGTDFITTNNYANTKLEFYYYIPYKVIEDSHKTHPLLVCVPPLSVRGAAFVGLPFKVFAEHEGFVIVAPSFKYDEKNWSSKRSYHFPSAWSGEALIKIINKLKKKHNLRFSKFYLYGFSAGAQFVLRFALWKPQLCAACVAHGSGGAIVPSKWVRVKFYVSVGKGDKSRIDKAEGFYNAAKKLDIDVIYRQYEGGHFVPISQISDSLKFFKDTRHFLR